MADDIVVIIGLMPWCIVLILVISASLLEWLQQKNKGKGNALDECEKGNHRWSKWKFINYDTSACQRRRCKVCGKYEEDWRFIN